MECDIVIEEAQFEVVLRAEQEVLYENEIYQPGGGFSFVKTVSLIFPGYSVTSQADARETVMMHESDMKLKVKKQVSEELRKLGLTAKEAKLVHPEHWSITLLKSPSDFRNLANFISF